MKSITSKLAVLGCICFISFAFEVRANSNKPSTSQKEVKSKEQSKKAYQQLMSIQLKMIKMSTKAKNSDENSDDRTN